MAKGKVAACETGMVFQIWLFINYLAPIVPCTNSRCSIDQVGHFIQILAGSSNLKHLHMELSGKSPNIVFPDADCKNITFSLPLT